MFCLKNLSIKLQSYYYQGNRSECQYICYSMKLIVQAACGVFDVFKSTAISTEVHTVLGLRELGYLQGTSVSHCYFKGSNDHRVDLQRSLSAADFTNQFATLLLSSMIEHQWNL